MRIARWTGLALLGHFDEFQLPDLSYRLPGNDQDLFFVQGNQNSAKHARVDAGRAWSCHLHLESTAGRLGLGYDLAHGSAALLVQTLDPHANVLADMEPPREGFADAGNQLHPFGIVERDERLARRGHVADVDFLVDDGAVDGTPNGCPIQHCLHFA